VAVFSLGNPHFLSFRFSFVSKLHLFALIGVFFPLTLSAPSIRTGLVAFLRDPAVPMPPCPSRRLFGLYAIVGPLFIATVFRFATPLLLIKRLVCKIPKSFHFCLAVFPPSRLFSFRKEKCVLLRKFPHDVLSMRLFSLSVTSFPCFFLLPIRVPPFPGKKRP